MACNDPFMFSVAQAFTPGSPEANPVLSTPFTGLSVGFNQLLSQLSYGPKIVLDAPDLG
jgi:hypothetical protein